MKKYFVILIISVLLVGTGVGYLYFNAKRNYECKDIAGGEFSIIFDTNGGIKLDSISICVGCENSLDGKLPTPKRSKSNKKYEFVGWYYDKELTEKVNSDEIKDLKLFKIYNNHNCLVEYGNITLYAKWKKK